MTFSRGEVWNEIWQKLLFSFYLHNLSVGFCVGILYLPNYRIGIGANWGITNNGVVKRVRIVYLLQ